MSDHNARLACVTCTPMAKITGPSGNLIYEPLDPRWHRARMGLSYGTNINASEICVDGLEVGDARSRVAARCRDMQPKPFCCFFLDSDVIPPNDAFTKLFYRLKANPTIDIAVGIYVVKGAAPFDPLIYQGNGMGAFWDFAVGDILTTKQHGITACHMGLTLIRTSLFDRMIEAGIVHGDGTDQDDAPFFRTESYRRDGPKGVETFKGTEDIWFCGLAEKVGCQILVDTSVLAGHCDRKTGVVYGLPGDTSPIERAKWLPLADGSGRRKDHMEAEANVEDCSWCKDAVLACPEADSPCPECKGTGKIKKPLLLAIDLGAGESRREWDGHKVYTLDSRRNSGADYIQELPVLNLPDNHYDMVTSRHSFEHVGRWDQETLWAECYRICKPGGKLEVIVPNAEWAAGKIVAGEVDSHVLNVLYGSQEQESEMGRESNTHFFCYTPAIGLALAETAGFEKVEVASFKTDESLGYHMVITALKPSLIEDCREKPGKVEAKTETNGICYAMPTLSEAK